MFIVFKSPIDSYPYFDPRSIARNKNLPVNDISFFCRLRVGISSVSASLCGRDGIARFGRRTICNADALFQKVALQQTDSDQARSGEHEPFCKESKIFCVNRKLAVVFCNLPFGIYLFFGLIAGGWDFTDTEGKGPRGKPPLESVLVEHIVGLFSAERVGGNPPLTAAEFNKQLRDAAANNSVPVAREFTEAELTAARVRTRELHDRWASVTSGSTLELTFPLLANRNLRA